MKGGRADRDTADEDSWAPAWPAFPERPIGLAVTTLLVVLPYLINASSSYLRVALGPSQYFITFVLPPSMAVVLAFLMGLWWQPVPSARPAAAAINVLVRTSVIVTGSLILGFILAHLLGLLYGVVADRERTMQLMSELDAMGHAKAVFARVRQALLDGGWGVLAAIVGARTIRAFVWPLGPPDPAGPAG